MITLGIDLSSMPEGTAACRIVWSNGGAVADPPRFGCDDAALDQLIGTADITGIDAPLGWPADFARAVTAWTSTEWSAQVRDRLRFRETDREIQEKFKLMPLSVSSDRIALPAMRAMALLKRHRVTDRSGDGRFYEVYPSGSLHRWNLPHRGYKQVSPDCRVVRQSILDGLRQAMPWLVIGDEYLASADSLDSLIASLTARAAGQGLTFSPGSHQQATARHEGWIHLPTEFPRP
jgi:predicted nuclease with RNAse H fold